MLLGNLHNKSSSRDEKIGSINGDHGCGSVIRYNGEVHIKLLHKMFFILVCLFILEDSDGCFIGNKSTPKKVTTTV